MAALIVTILFTVGALALGILLGRYYVPDDRGLRRSAGHAQAYMRAINNVLARHQDAAIEELKAVVKEDVSDVDPYFALGALFRARKEYERAIRVHQALELRAEGNSSLALRARYELGLDFRAAGMPRRAIRAMEECIVTDRQHAGALWALCGLYENERRFEEAASAWGRLGKGAGGNEGRIVHLLAAAGEQAAAQGDLAAARRVLKQAEKLAPEEPHVLCAGAHLAHAEGDTSRSRQQFVSALQKAPELAPFIVPTLCRLELESPGLETRPGVGIGEVVPDDPDHPEHNVENGEGEARFLRTLRALESLRVDDPMLLLARAELFARQGDNQRAVQDYRAAADRDPGFLPARLGLARAALTRGDPAAIEEELRALVADEGPLAPVARGAWRCRHCGAVVEVFRWRCDACSQWGTFARDIAGQSFRLERRDRRGSARLESSPLFGGGETEASDSSVFGRATTLLSGVWHRTIGGKRPPGDRNRM